MVTGADVEAGVEVDAPGSEVEVGVEVAEVAPVGQVVTLGP